MNKNSSRTQGEGNTIVPCFDARLEEQGCEINMDLEHGFVNGYRQFLFDRAVFEGKLGFADQNALLDFQIDEQLMKWYR